MPKKRKKAKKAKKKAKKKLKKEEEDSNLVFFIKNASHNFMCERRFFLYLFVYVGIRVFFLRGHFLARRLSL